MAYTRKWTLLADTVKLVMASGSSRPQAKRDICAALVDRAIPLNPTPPPDFAYPMYLFKTVLAPSDLVPRGMVWSQSRPKNRWPTKYGHLVPIAKLELSTVAVIRALCEGDSVAVATRALASHLEKNRNATRSQARTWCAQHGHELTDREFQFRVWPRARKLARLAESAPAGRAPPQQLSIVIERLMLSS
jgi:hypothetical protein